MLSRSALGGLRSLFFDSEAPGLVFSMAYLRGSSAPSDIPLDFARGCGFSHR